MAQFGTWSISNCAPFFQTGEQVRRVAPACFDLRRALASAFMRLLDRYLLRELLTPLGYCLGAFLILLISSDLFQEFGHLQELKLQARDIAVYYLIQTPEFLVEVMPMALLLSLLYTLTQHARHNEITAIRAAGVSLWRLSAPYFAVGFGASLAYFALNELWVPDSEERAERVKQLRTQAGKDPSESLLVRNHGFVNTRDGRRWQIGVFNLKTAEMWNLQVDWLLPEGSRKWLFAEHAIYTNAAWTFFKVQEYHDNGQSNAPLVPGFQTNMLVLAEFSETPDEIRSEIKISNRLGVRKMRRADIPIAELLDYLRLHRKLNPSDKSWLYTKLHGRLAAPWTCLIVVLIALPFGAASGRRNLTVGVASSLFICFSYYVLLQLGLALGTGGFLPPWLAAWMPNLAFGITGAWMTFRVR
jgi:lipopolysaccharide export system permease protein